MHEQEFERSVQQKMEELSFTPSAPVWERVEAEIRGRRKKRRLVFWLLPLLVTLIATGYFLFTTPAEKQQAQQKPDFVEPVTTRKEVGAQPKEEKPQLESKEKVGASIAKQKIKVGSPSIAPSPVRNNGLQMVAAIIPNAHLNAEQRQLAPADTVNDVVGKMDTQQLQAAAIPLITAEKSHQLPAFHPGQAPNAVNPTPIKIASASKWQWSFQLHYGRSQLAPSGGRGLASMDFVNMPSPVQSGNQNGNPVFWVPPMRVEDGPYVSGKVGLRKKIAARWYLHTGLQYARYTQRVAVGRKVLLAGFSSNRAFYDPQSTVSSYYNRFQMAGVPLSLQYKPFRKLPLEMEAGIVPAYLFGAKALRLDTATRLYVEHKPELRKFQLPVIAGIQYRFAKSKSRDWLAGAQMQYHVTGIHNRSDVYRLYAFSMGVQLRSR